MLSKSITNCCQKSGYPLSEGIESPLICHALHLPSWLCFNNGPGVRFCSYMPHRLNISCCCRRFAGMPKGGIRSSTAAACGNVLPFINLCHAAQSEIAVAATKNVFSCWNVVVHGRRVRWRWVGMGEWRCGSATQIEFQRSKSWNEINFLNFPSCSLAFRGSGTGVRSPDICIEVAGGVAVNRKVEKFLAPVG